MQTRNHDYKNMVIGCVLGVTAVIACAANAKELPALQYFQNATPGEQQKINVALYHLEEDERIIKGLQDQVTQFHARFDALEKRLHGFAGRDQVQQTQLDEISGKLSNTAEGLGKVTKRISFLESIQKPVSVSLPINRTLGAGTNFVVQGTLETRVDKLESRVKSMDDEMSAEIDSLSKKLQQTRDQTAHGLMHLRQQKK